MGVTRARRYLAVLAVLILFALAGGQDRAVATEVTASPWKCGTGAFNYCRAVHGTGRDYRRCVRRRAAYLAEVKA